MSPSAAQIATALVVACRNAGLDPERVFLGGDGNARARTVAGIGLVEARLAMRNVAARALGFGTGGAVSPSRRARLNISPAETAAVVDALKAAGFKPVNLAPVLAPGWSAEEDDIVREGVAKKWRDSVTANKLPGRSVDAVKKRRNVLVRADRQGVAPPRRTRDGDAQSAASHKARAAAELERLRAIPPARGSVPVNLSITVAEGWSDDRIAALKQHHALGLSLSHSGALLGVTKNAVSGERHRLGLCTPRPEPKPKPPAPQPRVKRAPLMAVAQPKPAETPKNPGPISSVIHPLAFNKRPAIPAGDLGVADRIRAILLREGRPLNPMALACFCDAKELTVSQALTMLERDGLASPGPDHPEGRRRQTWTLTAKAGAAA